MKIGENFTLICIIFLSAIIFFTTSVGAAPKIDFVSPILVDNVNTSIPGTEFNISVNESNLGEIKFNWNGTNYTAYENSLVLMMNFDNVSSLGENNSHVVDLSLHGNNGTFNGTTVWNSTGKYGGAFEFDGTTNYIDAGADSSLDITEDITISSWFKTGSTATQTMVGKRWSGGGGYSLGLEGNINTFKIKFTYYGVFDAFTASNAYEADNEWHHAMVSYNKSVVTFYLDGDAIGTVSQTSSGLTSGSRTLSVGSFNNDLTQQNYFNGSIDDVKVWNRSFSQEEAKEIYYGSLSKYDLNTWNYYLSYANKNLTNASYTYSASAENISGNGNLTETKTLNIISLVNTLEYYDNRKAVVVFTGDDWTGSSIAHENFVNASNAAQTYKVVFSPGITPGGVCEFSWPGLSSAQWADIQTEIDEGFVFPQVHSMNHPGNVLFCNYTSAGTSYENEINTSKNYIIGNLTLPWQNTFNNTEYILGWIEPYGVSDGNVRITQKNSNYLISRNIGTDIYNNFSTWNASNDNMYGSFGVSTADNVNISTLNAKFTEVYNDGGIYHIYTHPWQHNNSWTASDKIPQHLSNIGNRTDVWYPAWDHLYAYRYVENQIKSNATINVTSNYVMIANASFAKSQRDRYGLSYPITYEFIIPSYWSNIFVSYKNNSNENYVALNRKESTDFFNGIDAYRVNLSTRRVYVSKGFPQESNEFFLKIFSIKSSFLGNLQNISSSQLSSISNLVLEDSANGKINFSEAINLSGDEDIDSHVSISNNLIEINSTALPALNKSATLTLNNLDFSDPRILLDGAVCPSSICEKISYTGGTLTFTVTHFSSFSAEETPTSSSSSSGGASGLPIFRPNDESLTKGYEKSLKKDWKIKFNFENETHDLTVNKITNETITITVSSNPVTFDLKPQEIKKIDLNNDSFYDIEILLKDLNFKFKSALFFVKFINEKISEEEKEKEEGETPEEDSVANILGKNYSGYIFIIGFILLAIIIYLIKKRREKTLKP